MRGVASEETREGLYLDADGWILHLDLARYDSHHVSDDARLELACAFYRGDDFAIDEIRCCFEQFN
jgi:hypothetical protein